MLKIKNYLLISLFLYLFTGCASVKTKPKNQFHKSVNSLDSSERYFAVGNKLLKKGKVSEANFYFDQSLNVLLDQDIKNSSTRSDLMSIIDSISKIEEKYLRDFNKQKDNNESALIDEVISTPLFKPSQRQIKKIKEMAKDNSSEFSIPVTINSKVVSFITAFRTIRRKSIQNALNRSVQFSDYFKKIFREQGLPDDLAYLPIIESGYRIGAYSRARAVGVWQFMASTARLFGLRVDWVVDERRDPFKAARAAARYLKYLYEQFGDWYLALASYNGGPGKIKRAIKRTGRNDFFRLAKTRYIRRETKNYVPAFLASLIIAKSPEKYNFTIESGEKPFEDSKTVEIISPVKISQVAKLLELPVKTIKRLNPELIRDFTPFNKKTYLIRIPSEADENLLSELKKLPPKAKYFVGWYRVRKGDSLYSIARKFRTSVKKIKRVNKLRSNLIRPGKRLLIPRGYH